MWFGYCWNDVYTNNIGISSILKDMKQLPPPIESDSPVTEV